MRDTQKKLFTASVLLTFIFYSLSNGYRFFHSTFAGDSLFMIYQNGGSWEIALGRFVKPFLIILRGAVITPFLISVLTILWLSLSVCFVADFLEIKRLPSVAFIAAIMTCNITILSLNAAFLSDLDFYSLSLFLSILGVWLMKKERPLFLIAGSLSLSMSLGIYQSYICVSIALVMIHFLYKMPDFPNFKCILKKAVMYLLSFMAAAGIYYAVWKVFQQVFDIWTSDSYNGLASIGDYSRVNLGSVIATAYQNVLDYFIYPETFITNTFHGISMSLFWVYLIRLCNITAILITLVVLIGINIKRKTNLCQKVIQLLILLLFPLGINFVCVISKGMEHTLMIYAFYFVYILAIKLTESCLSGFGGTQNAKGACIPWKIVLASVMILSWSNIIYSNQVYLKIELQESAAQSIMTRIVGKIESMEDYVPGITPVAFSGSFESSPSILDAAPFDTVNPYGVGKSAMTYPGTNGTFLSYVLNVNINLTYVDSQDETVRQMPVYPAEGSIAYIDGIIVVKISE